MAFDGYLPKQDCQFMDLVKDELETYQQKEDRRRVLLFPPLPSRLRYLIHVYVEDLPELTTFSVGESWCRRVVVCHSELRDEREEDNDAESHNSSCEEPLRGRSSEEVEGNSKPKSSTASRSRGPKRPDKPLYMPRAARERLSLGNSHVPSGDQESPSPASNTNSCTSSSPEPCSRPETTQNKKSSSTQNSSPSGADSILNQVAESPACCPQVETLHGAEPLLLEQTESCFAEMTLEENEKSEEDPEIVSYRKVKEEIKAHLREAATVTIEHVHNDYSVFVDVCININLDEFRHVIEIYDFPALFKTEDLLDAFIENSDGGMKIKWIDNTHALGVFSSESAAIQALALCHPLLKTRALAEGSKKAKGKAIRCAEFIQPVKERPKTDCAVAQRMVTRALGLQGRGRVQRY